MQLKYETLSEVVARIHPPAGFSTEQIEAASRKAADRQAEWEREAVALGLAEQRKYYVLENAVKARDAILGRDR